MAVTCRKSGRSGHPEWKTTQLFKGVLENDMNAPLAGGERSVMGILAATHLFSAGNSQAPGEPAVWLTTYGDVPATNPAADRSPDYSASGRLRRLRYSGAPPG